MANKIAPPGVPKNQRGPERPAPGGGAPAPRRPDHRTREGQATRGVAPQAGQASRRCLADRPASRRRAGAPSPWGVSVQRACAVVAERRPPIGLVDQACSRFDALVVCSATEAPIWHEIEQQLGVVTGIVRQDRATSWTTASRVNSGPDRMPNRRSRYPSWQPTSIQSLLARASRI